MQINSSSIYMVINVLISSIYSIDKNNNTFVVETFQFLCAV